MRNTFSFIIALATTLGATAIHADDLPRANLKQAPTINSDHPAAKTESYKIYEKSEKKRTNLTDPNARKVYTHRPGLNQRSKAPGVKIYRQNRIGNLGTRSVRGCC